MLKRDSELTHDGSELVRMTLLHLPDEKEQGKSGATTVMGDHWTACRRTLSGAGGNLALFGQFVGDWDILEARYPRPDGTKIKRISSNSALGHHGSYQAMWCCKGNSQRRSKYRSDAFHSFKKKDCML